MNVRDLGGLPRTHGTTSWRGLVRADNLSRLTEAGRAALVDYGVRKVVDLRDPREVEKFPYPFVERDLPGVTIENVPLISEQNWAWYAKRETVEFPYVMIARLSSRNIADALRSIAAADEGVVAVHCHEGRERTGIIAAIALALAGVGDDAIARDWIESQPDSLKHSDITAVLDFMREASGGVREFVIDAGLTPVEADRVAQRLRG